MIFEKAVDLNFFTGRIGAFVNRKLFTEMKDKMYSTAVAPNGSLDTTLKFEYDRESLASRSDSGTA